MSKSKCATQRLVASETVAVDHCRECGVFHVHVGPVSLRIDAATFDTLVSGLAVARAEAKLGQGSAPWGADVPAARA